MATTWLQIRVELEGGGGIECDPPPGRVMVVGPAHSFEHLAQAIDAAFARWDVSHLHAFELADGRLIGYPDPDPIEGGPAWLDHSDLKVARFDLWGQLASSLRGPRRKGRSARGTWHRP